MEKLHSIFRWKAVDLSNRCPSSRSDSWQFFYG